MTLIKPLTTTPSHKRPRAKVAGPSPLFWFFAVLVSLAWAFLIFSTPARAALKIGTTVKVVNQVRVHVGAQVSTKTPNRRLKLGDSVVYQETVSTGKESAVNIRLIDESALIMGELTVLDSLVYDPNRGVVEGSLKVLSGMFRFSTSGVKMDVTIWTPVATIGVRGTVGMSRKAGNPDSAESQFFITLGRAASLDGKYTVIGKVIEGIEHADKLKPGRPPKNPDKIIRLSLGSAPKK